MSACTHTASLRGFDSGSTLLPRLENKSVAVVADPGRIQDGHSTRTDVYTYEFKDVSLGITEALQKRVSMTAKKVDIIPVSDVNKAQGYDFFLYPEVQSRSVHDFWTMGCLIKYGLEVRGKDGKTLVKESGEGKRNFFSANQVDAKCKEAMAEVFNKVTEKTLNQIKL